MIWRNGDGYPDPTAGEAISNIIREERLRTSNRRWPRSRASGS